MMVSAEFLNKFRSILRDAFPDVIVWIGATYTLSSDPVVLWEVSRGDEDKIAGRVLVEKQHRSNLKVANKEADDVVRYVKEVWY